jgi:hypothetical protein
MSTLENKVLERTFLKRKAFVCKLSKFSQLGLKPLEFRVYFYSQNLVSGFDGLSQYSTTVKNDRANIDG